MRFYAILFHDVIKCPMFRPMDKMRPLDDAAIGQRVLWSKHSMKCFRSGSRLDPDSIMWAKMTHKGRKKLRNFMFLCAGCSLLRAEGFFCGLDVIYGGLGIVNCSF
jgi:hypothetical protein